MSLLDCSSHGIFPHQTMLWYGKRSPPREPSLLQLSGIISLRQSLAFLHEDRPGPLMLLRADKSQTGMLNWKVILDVSESPFKSSRRPLK